MTHGMKNNVSFETVSKIMEMCSDDTKQLITNSIFISNWYTKIITNSIHYLQVTILSVLYQFTTLILPLIL